MFKFVAVLALVSLLTLSGFHCAYTNWPTYIVISTIFVLQAAIVRAFPVENNAIVPVKPWQSVVAGGIPSITIFTPQKFRSWLEWDSSASYSKEINGHMERVFERNMKYKGQTALFMNQNHLFRVDNGLVICDGRLIGTIKIPSESVEVHIQYAADKWTMEINGESFEC